MKWEERTKGWTTKRDREEFKGNNSVYFCWWERDSLLSPQKIQIQDEKVLDVRLDWKDTCPTMNGLSLESPSLSWLFNDSWRWCQQKTAVKWRNILIFTSTTRLVYHCFCEERERERVSRGNETCLEKYCFDIYVFTSFTLLVYHPQADVQIKKQFIAYRDEMMMTKRAGSEERERAGSEEKREWREHLLLLLVWNVIDVWRKYLEEKKDDVAWESPSILCRYTDKMHILRLSGNNSSSSSSLGDVSVSLILYFVRPLICSFFTSINSKILQDLFLYFFCTLSRHFHARIRLIERLLLQKKRRWKESVWAFVLQKFITKSLESLLEFVSSREVIELQESVVTEPTTELIPVKGHSTGINCTRTSWSSSLLQTWQMKEWEKSYHSVKEHKLLREK